jgi:hypothetical protein
VCVVGRGICEADAISLSPECSPLLSYHIPEPQSPHEALTASVSQQLFVTSKYVPSVWFSNKYFAPSVVCKWILLLS